MSLSNHLLRPLIYGCEAMCDSAERLVSRSFSITSLRPSSAAGSIHRSKSKEKSIKRPETHRSQTDSNFRTIPHPDSVSSIGSGNSPTSPSQSCSVLKTIEPRVGMIYPPYSSGILSTSVAQHATNSFDDRSCTSRSEYSPRSDTTTSDWSIFHETEQRPLGVSDIRTAEIDTLLHELGLKDMKTQEAKQSPRKVSYPPIPIAQSTQYSLMGAGDVVTDPALSVIETSSFIQDNLASPISMQEDHTASLSLTYVSEQIKKTLFDDDHDDIGDDDDITELDLDAYPLQTPEMNSFEDLPTWEEDMAIRRRKIVLAMQVRDVLSAKDNKMQDVIFAYCRDFRTVQNIAEDMIKTKTVEFMAQLPVKLFEDELVTARSSILAMAKGGWCERTAYHMLRAGNLKGESEHSGSKETAKSMLERARARQAKWVAKMFSEEG